MDVVILDEQENDGALIGRSAADTERLKEQGTRRRIIKLLASVLLICIYVYMRRMISVFKKNVNKAQVGLWCLVFLVFYSC